MLDLGTTRLLRTQTEQNTPRGRFAALKRCLDSFWFSPTGLCRSFVKGLSKLCQRFVQDLQERQALNRHRGHHALATQSFAVPWPVRAQQI